MDRQADVPVRHPEDTAVKPFVFRLELIRVKDGDTLLGNLDLGVNTTVKNQSIRLDECWCPELSTEEGKRAKAFTETWLAEAQLLIVDSKKFNPERSFERIVGVVYRDFDPLSLNDALINHGHATRTRK
jgi:endonuclease YncB( thermonuclease family)